MQTDSSDHEKYAIIGIGCRMPPAANSLDSFWKFLLRGGNALRPVRKDRWDPRQFFDEDQKRPGKMYAPKFAMLDADVKLFDPLAFGISPREAACMDPQQRLLLEVTWEAFEDAGIPRERFGGSLTGVFIGGFCMDHFLHQMHPANRHLLQAHSPVGASMTLLSNRISHAFDFRGPSLTMDTACSSSLVAVHYACQSLRLQESDMVIAGGVNTMMRPDFPILMSKGHFLSDHGECHAFDISASGYARGEGAGVFLIKRLADALAAGDDIHAVIRGSGVNQDGHTDGISLPNSEAQETLARSVYLKTGLAPANVDYLEAHGTGTQAGDPAETRALNAVFSDGRTKKLPVGSVKTNIGHLEAAAGAAGILKAVGVLKNRKIPPNLHFKNPNPNIPFADYCLEVVRQARDLPGPAEKPTVYAAINSFGYGGTNAHIIMESAPPKPPAVGSIEAPRRPYLVPLSACSENALRDLAGKFAFQAGTDISLNDLAHTAAFHRSHLQTRSIAVGHDLTSLRDRWIAASTGQIHEGLVTGSISEGTAAGLVFVYTGMGPQWWGMGQELMRTEPVFAAAVEEIDRLFAPLAGWSLAGAMISGEKESRMERTEVAQPANFAIQIALTRLWESFGIRPAAVVGHSVGEVVAAYIAGVYSLPDAVRISYHRSRLQQTTAGRGAMLAVGIPEAAALVEIADYPGVSIAAVNSFNAVTLSGETEQLQEIAATLAKREIFQKFLRVEVAYHSPQMDPLRDELLEVLSGISPAAPGIPLYSTAFGKIIEGSEWDADYWWRNVRQPVRFAAAVQAILETDFAHFLEIGPHPVLGNSIKECASHLEKKVTCYPSLRRKEPELQRILETLGELYCAGYELNWSELAPANGRLLQTPKYPWQRELHWVESDRSKMERLGLPGPVYLNRSVGGGTPAWEVEVNRQYFPFLMDHGVQDQTVFPGMGYLEAALCLSRRIHDKDAVILENVSFERVLIVDESKLQYLITGYDEGEGRFSIFSRIEGEEESVQRQARGRMIPITEPPAEVLDQAKLAAECPVEVAPGEFYERLLRRGLRYGPAFRRNATIHTGEGCFLVSIPAAPGSPHVLHPTVADAAIQPILFCALGDRLFVPFSIGQFEFFSTPESDCVAFGRLTSQSDSRITADVWLMDPKGRVLAKARNISLQSVDLVDKHDPPNLVFHPEWSPAELAKAEESGGAGVLILADGMQSCLAGEIAALLPGAIVVCNGDGGSPSGFQKDRFLAALGGMQPAPAKKILALWGWREGDPSHGIVATPEEILAANEKVVGFLQAAGDSDGDVDVTFVTRNAKSVIEGERMENLAACSSGALGLVAQNEYANLMCRSLDFDGESRDRIAGSIVSEMSAGSRGDIAYRNGRRFECVIRPDSRREVALTKKEKTDIPLVLRLGAKGHPDSLTWEKAERIPPGEGEIEIRVHTAAVNYKDVLKAEGRIHPIALEDTFWGTGLGMECAGVVTRSGPGASFAPGDRVVAILPDGFRTYATVPEIRAARIPRNCGMEIAGVPVVYMTAYRGLVDIAALQKGERVLIHNATGGLGLAAIDVANFLGAEIFATAGSAEKQKHLRDLGIRHVFASRNLDFGRGVMDAGGGSGIDVVIGAPTGQAMHVSLGLLRPGGRYIEVGKKDIAEDNSLPLRAFNRNLLFASLDIDRLALQQPHLIHKTLGKVLAHIEAGDFHPGQTQSLEPGNVRGAFEEMARSRHIGKLLIDLSAGEVEVIQRPEARPVIRPDGCYIVTGGTSGFGLASAGWLASKGAGRIVLVSRSGRFAKDIDGAVHEIERLGAEVEVCSVDVTDPQAVQKLLQDAAGPRFVLRGLLHAAMVLDDGMMADLTEEHFRKVFHPKALGALHLANALGTADGLDFLVFYSSISALVGNRGQTSYVAANAFLDALSESLRARGIPATSINWGALAESGVVARDERLSASLESSGITGLTDREALDSLELAIRSSRARVGVFSVDWRTWQDSSPKLADDPRFRELRGTAGDNGGDPNLIVLRKSFEGLPREQVLRLLEDHLQEVVAATLKMSKDTVSLTRKLNEIGVDSLMVLELSLGIKERIGIMFSAMEFLKGPTVQQLAVLAEKKL